MITLEVVTVNLLQYYKQINKQHWYLKLRLNVVGSACQKNAKTAFAIPTKALSKTTLDKKFLTPCFNGFFTKKSTPMFPTIFHRPILENSVLASKSPFHRVKIKPSFNFLTDFNWQNDELTISTK